MATRKDVVRQRTALLVAAGADLKVWEGMGKFQAFNKDESRRLSNLLDAGEMLVWLDGFSTGRAEIEGFLRKMAPQIFKAIKDGMEWKDAVLLIGKSGRFVASKIRTYWQIVEKGGPITS